MAMLSGQLGEGLRGGKEKNINYLAVCHIMIAIHSTVLWWRNIVGDVFLFENLDMSWLNHKLGVRGRSHRRWKKFSFFGWKSAFCTRFVFFFFFLYRVLRKEFGSTKLLLLNVRNNQDFAMEGWFGDPGVEPFKHFMQILLVLGGLEVS